MNVSLYEREIIKISELPIESIKCINAHGKNQILLASRDYKAYIIDISDDTVGTGSKIVKAFSGHKARVTDVEYSLSGDIVITVGADQKLIFWDRETMTQKVSVKKHTRAITSVAVNAQNNKIVTTSDDGTFIVWNALGEPIFEFGKNIENCHRGNIVVSGFIPATIDHLVTASVDGTVKIWDLADNSLLKTFIQGNYVDYEKCNDAGRKQRPYDYDIDCAVKAISFSKDGSLLAYGGRNSKVYLISLATNETLQTIDVPDKVTALASGENQPYIAIAIPNKILIWYILDSKFVAEYQFANSGEHYCNTLMFVGDELFAGLYNGDLLRISLTRN